MFQVVGYRRTLIVSSIILLVASFWTRADEPISETLALGLVEQLESAVQAHNTSALMQLLAPAFEITTTKDGNTETLSRAKYQQLFNTVNTDDIKTTTANKTLSIAPDGKKAEITLVRTFYSTMNQEVYTAESKERISLRLEDNKLLITAIEVHFL